MQIKLGKNKLKKIEWVALLFVLSGMFFTMFYADLTVTAQFSLTFIDSLFDGKYASFYNNALATGIAPEGAVYDIGMYIPLAIWGFPIWILKTFFDVSVLSVGSLLWFKLFLVFVAIGCGNVLKEIAEEIGNDRENTGKLWMLSLLVVFPVMVAVQYDIIPVFFMLSAILYSIRDERKKSLFFFSIAFTMKPFALLTFLVVILVKEKNILYIIRDGVIAVIPLAICKIIYMLNPVNSASNNEFLASKLTWFFEIKFDIGNGSVSMFCLLVFVICVMAYGKETTNDKTTEGKWIIWLLYLIWLDFCLFMPIYPYWIVYLAPFVVLVTLYDTSKYDLALVMELIANVGLIAIMVFRYTWVYGGSNTFAYLVLKNVHMTREQVYTVAGLCGRLGLKVLEPAIGAVTLGAYAVIAYMGYKEINNTRYLVDRKEEVKICSLHWWIRIGVLYAWFMLSILLLIISN